MTGDEAKARLAYLDFEAGRLAEVMRANRERLRLTVKEAGEAAATARLGLAKEQAAARAMRAMLTEH